MQFKYVATGLVLGLALAGCQRTSYNSNPYSNLPSQPAPLQAQPVPSVQSGQLPPPGGGSQFPTVADDGTLTLTLGTQSFYWLHVGDSHLAGARS